MSSRFELAQLNIASMKAPLESPVMADFVANLEPINALAERSPGFIWRLQDEAGDATAIRPFGAEVLVNLSVWRDVASLTDFAYRSDHAQMLRRRREWFERLSAMHQVLWWVPEGHRPSMEEGARRLAHLRERGPTPEAFTFRQSFLAPDQARPIATFAETGAE
ncbi:DUF3291 domain-containing protein [Metapseudomonas furukawaii]|uniref:DUF3291 domain-containing protein n=1 Tax=Metapseudomonas furukawaii TaxID=1149133 RepID=A0AAD1C1U5_METFU|nr:DUF3291 domain-containing protein [Pseudomonas furukawaii]ELS27609.1 Hypothetical protein ppKF707_2609 [Pseudomonas furukawaii]BAU74034.1 hypothetical protein KF707C_23460 [Pseudomonas furukawaii]